MSEREREREGGGEREREMEQQRGEWGCNGELGGASACARAQDLLVV